MKREVSECIGEQFNEFKKAYNLSKKYFLSQLKKLPKFVRVKIENALEKNLVKKLKEVNDIEDLNQRLDVLNDLVDFYFRYCNKESEHFNLIADKIIGRYRELIPG